MNPLPPIAITRCALLTPLDGPESDTWEAIRAGQRVEAKTAVDERLLAGGESLDRTIRLALAAAQRVAGGVAGDVQDVALFCGTSKGPVGTFLAAAERVRDGQLPTPAQAAHVALGVGAMGPVVARALGLNGGVHTSVAACSSGVHALHRAARALWRGECERALVVAADASLHPLFAGSFQRLGVLSPADARGVRACEPFGEEGRGFFLIEAAAAMLLERSPAVPPLAWLEDTWIGADASALIAIDPATAALRQGLSAMRASEPPAFVHAHATGTAHDAFELAAIRATLGERRVFSCKEFLGHSLGAAGLVSVALSAMCHREGETILGDKVAAGASSVTIAQGFGGHIGIIRLRGVSK